MQDILFVLIPLPRVGDVDFAPVPEAVASQRWSQQRR
jgi:hypothetical protein